MALETRTDSADLTFERFKKALASDGSGYPKGAVFVDAEAPYVGAALSRNMREGTPVVLIYPDGEERIVGTMKSAASTAGHHGLLSRKNLFGRLHSLLAL
jgi:hypothetical protein